jgi:serine/threonine protein kinase
MNTDISYPNAKQTNILVDDAGNARIADFGNAFYCIGISDTVPPGYHNSGTYRWLAPELVPVENDDKIGWPTFASDVFSFAMCVYEVSAFDEVFSIH